MEIDRKFAARGAARRLVLCALAVLLAGLQGCPDPDDDDSAAVIDDDDVQPDDDDSVLPDDDDSVQPDDDDDLGPDDDDTVLPDDDDTVLPDDDDTVLPDDDDTVLPDDDDTVLPDDDDSVLPDDDDDLGPDDDDFTPPPFCFSDPYEPNDTMATAWPLGSSVIFVVVACPDDDDWWSISASAGELATLGTDFDHTESDIALEMYDSAGTLVATSNTATNHEEVSYLSPIDQDIYTRLYLAADGGAYIGGFYGIGQWLCTPDAWEPNDDLASAAVLPGQISDFSLSLCSSAAEDWYVAPLAANDLLDVRATFDPADGDLDLNLYDPAGNLILSGLNETEVETLVHFVTTPGDYAIQVLIDPDDLGDGHVYDLDVNFAPAPTGCLPDAFEPNDDLASAPSITNTVYEEFTACATDEDLFAIDAVAGDSIELMIDFNHAEGDLDLHLLDAAGVEVASSTSSDDDEALAWPVPGDGTWYARVVLAADAGGVPGNFYGLALSGTTPACITDLFEPNDDWSTAFPIANGTYRDQTICPGDEDWFELSLSHLEELILDIGYDSSDGDVDLYLWDASVSTVLASGTTPDDDEQFTWIVSATGTYFAQVVLASDSGPMPGNLYDFGVVSIPSTTCSPDTFEPNDDPAAAWPLVGGSWTGLTVCQGEPDWFLLSASGPGAISADALFDHGEGDVDLHLYDPAGTLVTSATSTSDDETLSWPASGAGGYLLEVELVVDTGVGTGNDYDLVLSIP